MQKDHNDSALPTTTAKENQEGEKNEAKILPQSMEPMCQYTLVKSKRKGQQCHRKATKNHAGRRYCLYHYRMVSTRFLSSGDEPEDKPNDSVTQLQFPSPRVEEHDVQQEYEFTTPAKKRKRPVYNEPSSDDSSEDEMTSDGFWNANQIDFSALERMCLDTFHRNNSLHK